ncbi:MAG: hypothetical protein M0C28_33580 [Candidatus Moduliflexus flocculans]|nr:hypothetical protein [Candidatus Moduliflexus flocculans]
MGTPRAKRIPAYCSVYAMLWYYKYKTLQEKNYQRESSEVAELPNDKNDFDKYNSIAQQIGEHMFYLFRF